jgi:hypothetical protein
MRTFVLGVAAAGLLAGVSVAQTTTTPNSAGTVAPGTAAAPGATPRPGVTATPEAVRPTTGTAPVVKKDDTAAASGNNNQAVATTNANAPLPAKGSNSFTEAQARDRLKDNGFADVTGLKKDDDGVWRGSGKKNGKTADVWVDYKGNAGTSN